VRRLANALGLMSLLALLLMPLMVHAQGPGALAIRSLPNTIPAGATFPVTIGFSGEFRGDVTVREFPPEGWEVTAVSPAGIPLSAPLEWSGEIGHAGSPWFLTYEVRVPDDASGVGLFRGEAVFADGEPSQITGASTIEIGSSVTVWGFEINTWELIGILGTFVFASRFMVQWIASERKKKSVVPVAFWYISITGAAILLLYGIHFRRFAIVMGQSFGFFVYFRNLWLISRHQREKKSRRLDTADTA